MINKRAKYYSVCLYTLTYGNSSSQTLGAFFFIYIFDSDLALSFELQIDIETRQRSSSAFK